MWSACPLCFTCSLWLSTLKFNILWQSLNVKHSHSPLLAPCDFWQCIECTMCLLSPPFSFVTFLVERSWVSNFEHLSVRCECVSVGKIVSFLLSLQLLVVFWMHMYPLSSLLLWISLISIFEFQVSSVYGWGAAMWMMGELCPLSSPRSLWFLVLVHCCSQHGCYTHWNTIPIRAFVILVEIQTHYVTMPLHQPIR